MKKIAICHFRVGGTDGVSLEIEKRKKVLEEQGCKIKLVAGPRSNGADFTIDELEWDDGIIPIIRENGYSYFKKNDLSDAELIDRMYGLSDLIEKKLTNIQLKERFDAVLVHNVFSFGGHIAAARSFANWIEKFKIRTIATHHDFHWEREDFKMTRNGLLKRYMETYMPPKSKYIDHVVINSIAKEELEKRSGIIADVIPDIFDFSQPAWAKDDFNGDFLENFNIRNDDLVILQATRVLPRKGIELAIDLACELQKQIPKLRGKKLYNGKKLSADPRVVLIIAGYAEDEDKRYLQKLSAKAEKTNAAVKFISSAVQARRSAKKGKKVYSLWDAYVFADLVTFPSIWEGWGNQFIEAVFAKKPVAVFEYPVFEKDISKEGYAVISLGNSIFRENKDELCQIPLKNLEKATSKSLDVLLDPASINMLQQNFEIGKKYHGYGILSRYLQKSLEL